MMKTVLAIFLASVLISAQAPQTLPHFDVVIRGGTLIDGTGGAPYRGDVGILGKHIARVGDLVPTPRP